MDSLNESIINRDSSNGSFLQVLSDNSSSSIKEKEMVYIHPLSQRFNSSKLTEKSLQLCTENLGSETGTDTECIGSDSFTTHYLNVGSIENRTPIILQEMEKHSKKKMNNSSRNYQFPPPLTTLIGEKTIRVKKHRESGRLVIQAVVEATLTQSCFQAQRSHGRLRLCYVNHEAADSDLQLKNPDEIENENENIDENDCNNVEDQLENNKEMLNLHEVGDEVYYCNKMKEEMGEIDNEIEKEKFQRMGRCKEGENSNNGLTNWEPLWVAIS